MEQAILEQIQQLPAAGQQEALDYITTLVSQYTQNTEDVLATSHRKRQAGMMQGTFVLPLVEDFDAPLAEFEEYMG